MARHRPGPQRGHPGPQRGRIRRRLQGERFDAEDRWLPDDDWCLSGDRARAVVRLRALRAQLRCAAGLGRRTVPCLHSETRLVNHILDLVTGNADDPERTLFRPEGAVSVGAAGQLLCRSTSCAVRRPLPRAADLKQQRATRTGSAAIQPSQRAFAAVGSPESVGDLLYGASRQSRARRGGYERA